MSDIRHQDGTYGNLQTVKDGQLLEQHKDHSHSVPPVANQGSLIQYIEMKLGSILRGSPPGKETTREMCPTRCGRRWCLIRSRVMGVVIWTNGLFAVTNDIDQVVRLNRNPRNSPKHHSPHRTVAYRDFLLRDKLIQPSAPTASRLIPRRGESISMPNFIRRSFPDQVGIYNKLNEHCTRIRLTKLWKTIAGLI